MLSVTSDAQILDPSTGSIAAGPPMPTARGGPVVAVPGGRIHAI
jgi:hypothetical protein